jgi:hypothetical protein
MQSFWTLWDALALSKNSNNADSRDLELNPPVMESTNWLGVSRTNVTSTR